MAKKKEAASTGVGEPIELTAEYYVRFKRQHERGRTMFWPRHSYYMPGKTLVEIPGDVVASAAKV